MSTQSAPLRECRTDRLLGRWAAVIAIAAVAVVLFAAPGHAYAAGSIQTLENLPFETAAQVAGHPVWNSNSKVTLSGSARIAKGNTYSETTAYDFVKAGDSITLQNVGNDASGNAYDLKITMTACKGRTLNAFFSEGWHDGISYYCTNTMIQLCLAGPSDVTSAVQKGKQLSMCLMNQSSGDCTLQFQYLKHGTNTAANAALFVQVYDLDYNNYLKDVFAQTDLSKYSMFKGCEGIQTTDAKLYLSSSTKLSKDASDGKVWVPAANAGNVSGKDWSKGVAIAGTSATTTITFGAYNNNDLYFDYQKSPGSPSKSAKITS